MLHRNRVVRLPAAHPNLGGGRCAVELAANKHTLNSPEASLRKLPPATSFEILAHLHTNLFSLPYHASDTRSPSIYLTGSVNQSSLRIKATSLPDDQNKSSRNMEADEVSVSTFCSITGASPDVAKGFLSLSGSDVERAIELFFENPDLAPNLQSGLSSNQLPGATGASTSVGRQDSSGVIHIDSDDDNDIMHIDDDDDDDADDGRASAAQAAALAQEEEDAAMAKRLQEELYQDNQGGPGAGGMMGDEGVRAPIARTTETLVAPDPAWAGTDDSHVDSAILDQLRRRRMPPGRFLFRHVYFTQRSDRMIFSSSIRRSFLATDMGGFIRINRTGRRGRKPRPTSGRLVQTALRYHRAWAIVGRCSLARQRRQEVDHGQPAGHERL